MNKRHSDKWNKLEMLFETPEKVRAPPHTAKATSKGSQGSNRVFKFIRTNQDPQLSIPKSLNTINNILTPDRTKSRFAFENTLKPADLESRANNSTKPTGSWNSIENDADTLSVEKSGTEGNTTDQTTVKKKMFLCPDNKEAFIITTRMNKKYGGKIESHSMNQMDRFKIVDPICGIEDGEFQVLFKRKCEDMNISPSADTTDKFISNIRKKSLGTKLCFLESGFGKGALQQLATMIENNTEVSQLILRKSGMSDNGMIEPFAKSLAFMPNLVHLDLANNALVGQDFHGLFKNLSLSKTLISIDLSNYEPDKKNKLGAEGIQAFKSFVSGNIFLQFVTLSNLMLEDENTQVLIKALEECPNLLCLNLSSNVFAGKCLEDLSSVFAKTGLIKLDLSNNKLKKEAAVNLAKFIQTQRSGDKDAKGVELVLQNTGLGPEINTIFESLGKGSNVKKLDFSQNPLNDIEITHFETALSENKIMQELNLSECKLGEIGGKLLALGLKKNKGLQNLMLGGNNFGDSAGALIIYSLLDNPSLKSLDLSQNKLEAETAKALQEIIKRNPNLQKYNLSLNNFDEPEGYLLQEALFFNARIVQFNIAYSKAKFTTIEAIERVVKDNQHKLEFATVPKLREEVGKKKNYIEGEKQAIEKVDENLKKKEEVKRDVKRFQDTLVDLQTREKSPTSKKKERLVLKLSKDIKETQPVIEDVNAQIREFKTSANLEMESYKRMIEGEQLEIEKNMKKIEAKKEEVEKVKQKYEPDIKILRYEITKLMEENRMAEMYNNAVTEKIKTEKQINNIHQGVAATKVSDVFLATSELAKAKKKAMESPDKIGGQPSVANSTGSQSTQNLKLAKEMEYFEKTRQSRTDKLIKEVMTKDEKAQRRIFRRQNSKSDNSKQELMRDKVNEKLKNMFEKPKMEPIAENETKE